MASRFSFIKKEVAWASLERITDMNYRQSVLERLLGIATIYINTAGTDMIEVTFFSVKDPAGSSSL